MNAKRILSMIRIIDGGAPNVGPAVGAFGWRRSVRS